jgi:hypothetical protein
MCRWSLAVWWTIALMRATERQRRSGQQRPAWPGNAMAVMGVAVDLDCGKPAGLGCDRLATDGRQDGWAAPVSSNNRRAR